MVWSLLVVLKGIAGGPWSCVQEHFSLWKSLYIFKTHFHVLIIAKAESLFMIKIITIHSVLCGLCCAVLCNECMNVSWTCMHNIPIHAVTHFLYQITVFLRLLLSYSSVPWVTKKDLLTHYISPIYWKICGSSIVKFQCCWHFVTTRAFNDIFAMWIALHTQIHSQYTLCKYLHVFVHTNRQNSWGSCEEVPAEGPQPSRGGKLIELSN